MDIGTIIIISTVTIIFLGIIAAAVFIAPQISARNRLRRRIGVASGEISAQSGKTTTIRQGGRKRDIKSRLKEVEEKKTKSESRAVKYRLALRQAGMDVTVRKFTFICLGISLVTLIVYFFLPYPKFAALPLAITIGFGLPVFYVKFRIKRRTDRFTARFADSVDIIVRGIRSGLPVGKCLNIVAREAPDPINGIFFEIIETTKLGPVDIQDSLIGQSMIQTSF